MNSLSYDDANRIFEDNPTVFKRQEATVNGQNLVLFDYFYANWQIFRDNPMSRNLRGVIFDADTRQIVSLPFHKFFNVNENPSTVEEELKFDGLMMDKQDGSMAQVTFYNGQMVVASRSSLTGYVNKAVTEFLANKPELTDFMRQYPSHTFLFEFLDPDNRIVLGHDRKELVFLNARDKYTGDYSLFNFSGDIPCRTTPAREIYPDMWERVKEGLESAENFEGFVLWLSAHKEFYKIKTAWYVASHKLVTEQSPRAYLEAWASDKLDDLAASLQALGHGGVLKEISSFVRSTESLLYARVCEMIALAGNYTTAKDVAIALNGMCVKDDVDRMVFGAVMRAYRDGDLDPGVVFNNFRKSLSGTGSKLKVIVEAVESIDK